MRNVVVGEGEKNTEKGTSKRLKQDDETSHAKSCTMLRCALCTRP